MAPSTQLGNDGGWQLVRRNRQPPNDFSLFVGNITFDTSREDLSRIFGKYGKLTDIHLPGDHSTGRPRGFAFVRFLYEADAHKAIDVLNGHLIDGRKVSVLVANPKKGDKIRTLSRPQRTAPTTNYSPALAFPTLGERTLSYSQVIKNAGGHHCCSNQTAALMETLTIPDFAMNRVTIRADPIEVESKQSELRLALVGYATDFSIPIIRLMKCLRDSKYAASAIDVARIGPTKFLITFKTRLELLSFSADTTKKRGKGYGLGVSFARDIILSYIARDLIRSKNLSPT